MATKKTLARTTILEDSQSIRITDSKELAMKLKYYNIKPV